MYYYYSSQVKEDTTYIHKCLCYENILNFLGVTNAYVFSLTFLTFKTFLP